MTDDKNLLLDEEDIFESDEPMTDEEYDELIIGMNEKIKMLKTMSVTLKEMKEFDDLMDQVDEAERKRRENKK